MTAPYIDPEWHKQKKPEEWQAINQQATQDYHKSLATGTPDREALQAIKDSNEALNAYEQPAITAGSHVLASGWGDPLEAVKGEARGAAGAVGAPFHLANTMYRQGAGAGVDEIVKGITSIPGEIASGDPERIGEVAGGAAGGIAMGRLGAKIAKGAGGVISDYAERPALKNALLKAQTAAAQNSVAKSGAILPDAIEQSGLKTDTMRQNLSQKAALHPDAVEQAGLKTNTMHQNVAEKAGTLHDDVEQARLRTEQMKQGLTKGSQDIQRGAGSLDATTERPGLQNELTRLQIEKLRKLLDDMNDEGEAGPSGSAPTEPPDPNAPPNDILNPREQAKLDPKSIDPYGLDNLTKPTDPMDQLGGFINDLKSKGVRNEAPHDILDSKNGPRPLSPEEINRLLKGL